MESYVKPVALFVQIVLWVCKIVSCICHRCNVDFSPSANPNQAEVYTDFCSALKPHADDMELKWL